MKDYKLFINGKWEDSCSGKNYQRVCPANGEVVDSYPLATAEDTDKAIKAAREAFDHGPWPKMSAIERGQIIRKAVQIIRDEKDELAKILALEVGKPLGQALGEVVRTAELFEYASHLALDFHGDSYKISDTYDAILVREPIGVVGVIIPWNFPLMIFAFKVAPALSIGCTVVCKPATYTAGIAYEAARIFKEAGLPDGVLNVISGDGSVVGDQIAKSTLVDKVTFTGSTVVGQSVMRAAANNTKRVSLELGGKSPNIVFEDVPNLDFAVNAAVEGMFFNQGEVCDGGTRLLLQRSIHDQFMEKLIEKTKHIRVGNIMDDVDMGAVISEQQFEIVMNYIEIGKKEAKLVLGGHRLTGGIYDKGFYIEPTIFDDVAPDARIAQEEIFGPVLVVHTFETVEEAIAIANNSQYGLASGLFSKDIYKAMKVAKALQAGTVYINEFGMGSLQLPFGGYKLSGIGREKGAAGMNEFSQLKSIHIQTATTRSNWID